MLLKITWEIFPYAVFLVSFHSIVLFFQGIQIQPPLLPPILQLYGLTALPTNKHTVALFEAELSRCMASRTARVYLAAVSPLPESWSPTPAWHNPSLQLALCGMAHYHPSQQALVHKPNIFSIFNSLLTDLHSTQRWCKHDHMMVWAALSLAFYGFLRGTSLILLSSWLRAVPVLHVHVVGWATVHTRVHAHSLS